MNILCTTAGTVDALRPKQGITDIAGAGFRKLMLDLRMYCPPGELEGFGKKHGEQETGGEICLHPEKLRPGAGALLEQCANANLRITAALAPCLNWDTKRKDLKGLLSRLALEGIGLCGDAGCEYLVVRPLFSDGGPEAVWKENREYYLGLADAAEEKGVTILLANQCREVGGHLIRGVCADAEEAARWVDRLNEEAGGERFGFCMDVGAYSLCGQSMRETALLLGKRVKAVILRDCGGRQEASLLPFTAAVCGQSATDWLGLIRGLREICFDGELILDMGDTAAAFSPLLRPGLLAFAKSVSQYLEWQIGIEGLLKKYQSVVLFGAGNMCRNYMKCYGEKYPPLFTCDNDSARWGERFCGLEVRPPESLINLPEDCAVLICNIYYREIERQLKDMGVQNPIEYFNDEYMQSFFFDRLPVSGAVRN